MVNIGSELFPWFTNWYFGDPCDSLISSSDSLAKFVWSDKPMEWEKPKQIGVFRNENIHSYALNPVLHF